MIADSTSLWIEQQTGEKIENVARLTGGWTSEMRRVDTATRSLVLRSFVSEFFRRHADGLLTREADILRLLGETDVPAASLVAVDPTGASCADPSLLMTLLPGRICLDDPGITSALAAQLVAIHQVEVDGSTRPRDYQAWTSPERVRLPEGAGAVWTAAVDVIRGEPPAYKGVFLHRDYHPGNVLFEQGRISGIVDWVETSWGPADLDVAHCSTALALLHGPEVGLAFPAAYVAAGGSLTQDKYWYFLDTLGFAPDAEKVAVPWRQCGREDLTPALLQERLENYLTGLLD
ncbi:phosphotransferase family protein [Kribbella deserti]|uniref:Phosphotransferase family protein n=1 Tax=Kribbella deserti TaxID=1926257 RepID=A0ABV6QR77_9ACTN